MPPQERVLFHEYGTELRIMADATLILNVLCGRVGEFGVEFPLNDAECEEFRRRGVPFIKDFARKVREDPEAFANRGRTY